MGATILCIGDVMLDVVTKIAVLPGSAAEKRGAAAQEGKEKQGTCRARTEVVHGA